MPSLTRCSRIMCAAQGCENQKILTFRNLKILFQNFGQTFRTHRFRQMCVHPGIHRLPDILLKGVRRHCYNGKFLHILVIHITNRARCRIAIHMRQLNIHEDQSVEPSGVFATISMASSVHSISQRLYITSRLFYLLQWLLTLFPSASAWLYRSGWLRTLLSLAYFR